MKIATRHKMRTAEKEEKSKEKAKAKGEKKKAAEGNAIMT